MNKKPHLIWFHFFTYNLHAFKSKAPFQVLYGSTNMRYSKVTTVGWSNLWRRRTTRSDREQERNETRKYGDWSVLWGGRTRGSLNIPGSCKRKLKRIRERYFFSSGHFRICVSISITVIQFKLCDFNENFKNITMTLCMFDFYFGCANTSLHSECGDKR